MIKGKEMKDKVFDDVNGIVHNEQVLVDNLFYDIC